MPGLRDNPDIPRADWQCAEVADLRALPDAPAEVVCEVCGEARIRFVHVLEHEAHPESVGACAACAEDFTGDRVNPRAVEVRVRLKSAAREEWLNDRWRLSIRKNHVLQVNGHSMSVFPVKFKDGLWSARLDSTYLPGMYPTVEEALNALFDEYWKLLGH
jgi:hypothetical protein